MEMASWEVWVENWLGRQQACKYKLDVRYILDGESTGVGPYLTIKEEKVMGDFLILSLDTWKN